MKTIGMGYDFRNKSISVLIEGDVCPNRSAGAGHGADRKVVVDQKALNEFANAVAFVNLEIANFNGNADFLYAKLVLHPNVKVE